MVMRKILTFLGTTEYKETTVHIGSYTYGNPDGSKSAENTIFPLSLIKYYREQNPNEPLSIFFLLTEGAKGNQNWKKTQPVLDKWKEEWGLNYDTIDVPDDVESSEATLQLVKSMINVLENGDEVVLDVTHCFRDIPLTALVAALYIKEALNVSVQILYGKLKSTKTPDGKEINNTETKDITYVTQLTEWLYAARLFREYGYSKELGELTYQRNREIRKQNRGQPKRLNTMKGYLSYLTNSLRLGSINLLRTSVRAFLFAFEEEDTLINEIHEYVPELDTLLPAILERYDKLDTGMEEVSLNSAELKAERELLKFYMETNDINMALHLAREYLINIALYKENLSDFVFDKDKREEVSRTINENGVIKEARNHIAHFGFNDSNNLTDVNTIEQHLRRLIDTDIDELYNEMMKNKQDLEASSYAVVSSLGLTEGALYTILNHYNPNLLIVVTSKEGAKILPSILEKTQFKGECHVVNVEDPYTGKEEIARVSKEVTGYLENTRKVVINLTGGTTLLNYMLLKVGDEARHGKTIKTVLAVDKRSYEEQKVNPYVVGEVVELD